MKKLLLSLALIVAATTTFAQHSVTFANAHWGFEASEASRPNASTAAFTIPTSWVAGTSIATYRPYIYPNGNQSDKADQGHTGRYCLHMNQPNSDSRLPIFCMLPTVSDKQMNTLKLEFWGRTFNSTLDVNTSNTIYGDWKFGYITSLADTLKTNFTANVHFVETINLTANWTKYTLDLKNFPNGAYPVIYIDAMGDHNVRYAFIDDVAYVTSSNPEPENPTVTYNLTHCTGAAENPTEVDNENIFEAVFTLEDGYEWGTPVVTIGGVAMPDMMVDYMADPAYYADIDDNTMTLQIITGDDIEEDVVITLICTEAQQAVTPIPGAATFEEYLAVLPQEGDKYNPYNADGTHYWQSGDYTFSCTRSWGGMMNDGFYPANYSDTNYVSYVDDYKALPCAGANGSSAYCSMYYGGSWGGPCTITFSERTPTGTYVVLPLNPYLCIHGRNGGAAAFTDGDYLLLRLSGKKNGVYTNTHVDFYLADYRDGKRIEITDWTWLDLSSLGTVDEIEVTMYDSQNGAGIGDYACFDNFGGTPTTTGCMNVTNAPEASKILLNGQVLIRRCEHLYNTAGQIVR